MEIEKLAVFSGSRLGNNPAYVKAAELLADTMYEKGMTMVYGGGRMGLMGVVSERLMKLGGRTIGIVPEIFRNKDDEKMVSELYRTESMSERKDLMISLADAFIVLPGGIGTIDEYSQTIVYRQLGMMSKPSVVLNIDGVFDNLEKQMDVLIEQDFISPGNRDLFCFAASVEEAFVFLEHGLRQ